MAENSLPKWVKPALEFGPLVAFFVAYLLLKDSTFQVMGEQRDGFIVVTMCFIPLLLASIGALWFLTGKLSKMQIVTAVLVTVFGGLSIWFNDGSFFKMKPTIIYLLFAGILGFGLLRGKSYLRSVMEELMPLQPEGWMILTKRLALFFLVLAVANEVVWRGFSESTWVYFKTFGLSIAMFGFLMSQGKVFEAYEIKEDDA